MPCLRRDGRMTDSMARQQIGANKIRVLTDTMEKALRGWLKLTKAGRLIRSTNQKNREVFLHPLPDLQNGRQSVSCRNATLRATLLDKSAEEWRHELPKHCEVASGESRNGSHICEVRNMYQRTTR